MHAALIFLINAYLLTSKTGTVTQKNDDVESAPSLINNSPEKDGWLFKVKLSDTEELKSLMDQAAYENYLKEHEE